MALGPVAYLPPAPDPAMVATHLVAGVGSGLLLVLGVAAFARRGSRSYLLVVLALAALVAADLYGRTHYFPPECDDLDVARSTLEWHLDRLVAEDVVRKSRDERGRVTLALADLDRTARYLAAVDPSLPDRLVDRFDRLLDALLPE
ncbi:MAG: hypothetical protein V5A44_11925 [Haloarculaceae archaeon]